MIEQRTYANGLTRKQMDQRSVPVIGTRFYFPPNKSDSDDGWRTLTEYRKGHLFPWKIILSAYNDEYCLLPGEPGCPPDPLLQREIPPTYMGVPTYADYFKTYMHSQGDTIEQCTGVPTNSQNDGYLAFEYGEKYGKPRPGLLMAEGPTFQPGQCPTCGLDACMHPRCKQI